MVNFIKHGNIKVPQIKGGKKGGGNITPNSLFSTDILFVTNAFGEGPVYRINPNGPQDIQINDSVIDDLINIDGDGLYNTDKFVSLASAGSPIQSPLPMFGEVIVSPQGFSSSVTLKKGNLPGIPSSKVTTQETSVSDWDSIRFNFILDELFKGDDDGNVSAYKLSIKITIYQAQADGGAEIATIYKTFSDKTDTSYKFSVQYNFADSDKSENGYRFTVEKDSPEVDDSKIGDTVRFIGWDEIKNSPQAYPRTALAGYAVKAVDEHTGGVPNFTSLLKGLLVKVPTNYNQPILSSGEIDWRQLEVPETGTYGYTTNGYRLQISGTSTVLTDINPYIYSGVWDGTFVYSWTQNPVWIVYDLLTNKTYGLGIAERNIDKYKFYQVAMYCDACNTDGQFVGVDGLSDGTFRNKPNGYKQTDPRDNQLGLPSGIQVKERRFISDISITENEQAMDILNKITASFRGILTYAGGKVTLAVDMPDEYPVMLFTDANIKKGTLQLSGVKESEILTGIDISYIEPSNHFKRETIRLDSYEANDGLELQDVENTQSMDLAGVTRRSQAMRAGQYQLAASKYLRRNISFEAFSDASFVAPGDVISVATQSSGALYGYSGKVNQNSSTSNTTVFLEHYTYPSISDSTFTSNTHPLVMRVIRNVSDTIDLYVLSNTNYSLSNSGDVMSGSDLVQVNAIKKYNKITRTFENITAFTEDEAPTSDDFWSIGEIENINNYYTSKSGKLFKVTNVSRDPEEFTIKIDAIEYISEVYEDSDTYINYSPVSYTDVLSPITTPPVPSFDFNISPRARPDGSVVMDAVLRTTTDTTGYVHQNFETEYYVSYPDSVTVLDSITGYSPLSLTSSNADVLENSTYASLSGKNGFSSNIGEIKLLCTNASLYGANEIRLSLEGLNYCLDTNFNAHVLDIIGNSMSTNIKGGNIISFPAKENSTDASAVNFVGYFNKYRNISAELTNYDTVSNYVYINNNNSLYSKLPPTPFYVTIRQPYDIENTDCNTFFVSGSTIHYVKEGALVTNSDNTIDLESRPRSASDVSFYVEGIQIDAGSYTVNINSGSVKANIVYGAGTDDHYYRTEYDVYTVPAIEVGDKLQSSFANTYTVVASSYDANSVNYNSNATNNRIYSITTNKNALTNLANFKFINITQDPIGIVNNVSSNSFTFDYNTGTYPGQFNLANNSIYSLIIGDNYTKQFSSDTNKIEDVPLGNIKIKARNRNVIGRLSPFVTKYKYVEQLPISRVSNIVTTESLYREQTGGVSVRVTIIFDHIQGQEVTDYEIAYKMNFADTTSLDYSATLTDYNTVKVSAEGVDSAGKIRYTVSGVNRGGSVAADSINFRVTPLNKSIRGFSAYTTHEVHGKEDAPLNIYNFTGGQQTDQLTLFWKYRRINDSDTEDLVDIDLKEVLVRRILGDYSSYTSEQLSDLWHLATSYVTVAAGTQRKSVPIDNFGTYTYLAKTRDTTGNYSDDVQAIVITTSRPKRTNVIAAYSEDEPNVPFSDLIVNNNSAENNFPSFADATDGVAGPGKSAVDNANGYSEGYVATLDATDILADSNATYITQVRDFGAIVHGSITIEANTSQGILTTYNDMHEEIVESVSDVSTDPTILIDADFTATQGIGDFLGYSDPATYNGRYDSNNRTWVTGPTTSAANVWAIWNHGQTVGDAANANSYALIAGVINADAIALGESYYANGEPTGGNTFSNVTSGNATYTLVNLRQYSDTSTSETYQGDLSATKTQMYMRTSTADTVYNATGNVDVSAFDYSDINEGFLPYEGGTRPVRFFQIKHVITNNRPDEYSVLLDKFRYTLDKEQTLFTSTVSYSASPTTVDYSSSNFVYRPNISYAILDQTNPETNTAIVVTTSASNTSVSFKLFAADGSGAYPADGTANVMVTAIGV